MTTYYVNPTTGGDEYDGLSPTVDGGGVGPKRTLVTGTESDDSAGGTAALKISGLGDSAGDAIELADGTYVETDGATAFRSTQAFANSVRIYAANAGAATVKGGGSYGFDVYWYGAQNQQWDDIVFSPADGSSSYPFYLRKGCENLVFNRCTFACTTDQSTAYGLYIDIENGETMDGIEFNDCTMSLDAQNASNPRAFFVTAGVTGTLSGLTISGGTLTSNGRAFYTSHGHVEIDGLTISCASYGIQLGADPGDGVALTGHVRDTTITNATATGHGVLLSTNCEDFELSRVRASGGDYTVVDKGLRSVINACLVIGGDYALSLKGSRDADIYNNTFIGRGLAGGSASTAVLTVNIQVAQKLTGLDFQNNILAAGAGEPLVSWDSASFLDYTAWAYNALQFATGQQFADQDWDDELTSRPNCIETADQAVVIETSWLPNLLTDYGAGNAALRPDTTPTDLNGRGKMFADRDVIGALFPAGTPGRMMLMGVG